MKSLYRISLKIIGLLIVFSGFTTSQSIAGEFVIMNRVISWDVNSGDAFWSFKPDATMPSNWKSPENYFDGKIYTRYEVLSVATNVPFGLQFDLFQWKNPEHTIEGELCEDVRWMNNGAGTVVESSSTPSAWWSFNGGVDFSKINDLQSLSITIWCNDPQAPVSKAFQGGDDAGIAWSKRFNWFPVEVRVTVIAVSYGSTFSGWENYVPDLSTMKPKPSYGIDFLNETTDKIVPPTDEYSMFPEMTYAVSGNNQKISLMPGRRYYFRTKAGNGLAASPVQILVVPERPATPAFALDQINNRTTATVNSSFEYSDNPDMSQVLSGAGDYVSIPAGTSKFFRKKATVSTFRSNIQTLNASSRAPIPHEFVIFNNVIDYPNTTDTNGFYYFWHNADMPVNWLSPENYYNGQIYVRYQILEQNTSTQIGLQFGIWQKLMPESGELYETMSEVKTLNGPGSVVTANSSPSSWWKLNGGVDYTRMNLTWHFGINPWKVSTNQQIRQENPGVWNERYTYWFPMKVYVTIVAVASGYSFSGWNNYLGVKPQAPVYTFSYETMETDQVVPSTDEYSFSPDMVPAYQGTGAKITVTPGQDIYFRTKANGVYTASDIRHVIVPARPQTPAFTIDYLQEYTSEIISSEYEYSSSSDMSNATVCPGTRMEIMPGSTLYFRKKATSTSFSSLIQTLAAPARPSTPSYSIDYDSEKTVEIIGLNDDYSYDSDMSQAVSGTNARLDLTPGSDLYFRTRATGSSFSSDIQFLEVKDRPATPVYTIDFANSTTNEIVNSQTEFSEDPDFSVSDLGSETKIVITPGVDLYFRKIAGDQSFASTTFHLDVPEGINLIYLGNDTILSNQFILRADKPDGSFTLDELLISNGTAMNLRQYNAFDVVAINPGAVVVYIPATSNAFASNIVRVYYDNSTGFSNLEDEAFSVFPNPTNKGRICIFSKNTNSYAVDLISAGGLTIRTYPETEKIYQYLELSDLSKGIYFLKIKYDNSIRIQKIVLE
jgi:hypothetical protein